ncbi:nucleotidyl transferase AbiEii/AbiGii toxin family protein [Cyanobium sp. BA20m-p-22]|nr:nucleotidyl transferase AbiEii/AbiGii toxin family protein [Cyanobium sp. BA20m-p-22]
MKLEVDTHPPLVFYTEGQLLLLPYSFYVKCFALPDLFAGKMHAVLFRQWQQRVKGRDWFDLEWYVRCGIPLHLNHLAERARQSGHWPSGSRGWMWPRLAWISSGSCRSATGGHLVGRVLRTAGQPHPIGVRRSLLTTAGSCRTICSPQANSP